MFNLRKILLCLCLLFLFVVSVKADSLEVFSVEVIHGGALKNDYADLEISINMSNYDRNEQKVLLSESRTDLPDFVTVSDSKNSLCTLFSPRAGSLYPYVSSADYLMFASVYGDVYLTIYEYDGSVYQKVSNSILVKRPALLDYSERIGAAFYSDKSLSLAIHDIYNEESSLKFRIGEVSNSALLKMNAKSLLGIAKNDNNVVKEGVVKLNSATSNDDWGSYHDVWDPGSVTIGKYYYVYFEIVGEDGKYYSYDDIGLYKVNKSGDLLPVDDWKVDYEDIEHGSSGATNYGNGTVIIDSNKTSSTTENPKTGVYSVGVLSIMVLFVSLFFVRKVNLFKKI